MQTIYLDISNKGTVPCINAKQSEVGRKFLAIITDGGVPYNVPNDALLSVWYEGSSDAGNYSSVDARSAFSIDGNKVTVELVAQMLFKPGKGELCLSISHADGAEINTWNIPYCVEYKPGAGSPAPTEYYTALTDAAARAAEQVGYAADAAELASEHREAAEAAAEEAANAMVDAVKKTGDTMSGNLAMGGNAITGMGAPTDSGDATNKAYVDGIWDKIYPVGSVYISTAGVNPATLFGGVWEQISGKFLLASSEDRPAGESGGAEEHWLTEEQMPTHKHHGIYYTASDTTVRTISLNPGTGGHRIPYEYADGTTDAEVYTGKAGGNQPFSIMPPYLSVNVWTRTE